MLLQYAAEGQLHEFIYMEYQQLRLPMKVRQALTSEKTFIDHLRSLQAVMSTTYMYVYKYEYKVMMLKRETRSSSINIITLSRPASIVLSTLQSRIYIYIYF